MVKITLTRPRHPKRKRKRGALSSVGEGQPFVSLRDSRVSVSAKVPKTIAVPIVQTARRSKTNPEKRDFGVLEERDQSNFTDSESRIMKQPNGGFDYSYNAQTAVDAACQIGVIGGTGRRG
jgi:hypothetical protein